MFFVICKCEVNISTDIAKPFAKFDTEKIFTVVSDFFIFHLGMLYSKTSDIISRTYRNENVF